MDLGGSLPALEDTPKISLQELRTSALWPILQDRRRCELQLMGPDGQALRATITLVKDTRYRWRLRCEACGAQRWHLHLCKGRLACRRCHGLLYAEQLWPDSRWRLEVGRPILRQWRRALRQEHAGSQT